MTFCKAFKVNTYHFVTLCGKFPPIRYKTSVLRFMCTYTKRLTYIKGKPFAHFEEKALEVSANIRIFVLTKRK